MIYYAVEYRNMRTAIHGLFLYLNPQIAYNVDDVLSNMSDDDIAEICSDDFTFSNIIQDSELVDHYEEIHYKNVNWDDTRHEYVFDDGAQDGDTIIVVNTGHVVHDLYL